MQRNIRDPRLYTTQHPRAIEASVPSLKVPGYSFRLVSTRCSLPDNRPLSGRIFFTSGLGGIVVVTG